MADRLIVDLGADGQVSVSTWLEGELPGGPVGGSFELEWPLDDEALEHLRWYLEDYLRAPFGVYEDRGPTVAAQIPEWGERVFRAAFASESARDAYVRLRARANTDTEIVFRSASPALLGLPWELLRDPGRSTPPALDLVGVTRSLPGGQAESFAAAGERLRVLMVISRPSGTEDVGYRMIARPLLERLDAVRGRVELVVLRPPTLEALAEILATAKDEGQPFQVVHFDGHGVLARQPPAVGGRERPLTFMDADGEGMLAFEKPTGGGDDISASRLAQVLKEAQVPLVVLNACQSGAVGKELEAAVATRLLQEGVASVVAMAYTVYAVAAAEFMTAFYERLFAGDRVTEAVGAGRRRLFTRNERPSPKGELPLEDWLVPVHYLRREIDFPYLQTESAPAPSLDAVLDDIRDATGNEQGALEATGEFVGRDALFYELEVAARLQRAIVLHGPGGTGKTELAKAFGRWWRDTGGVDNPDWVIFHSFEPGVASFGLDGVIASIGLRLFGADFALLDDAKRRAAVEKTLRDHRLLLIWDNFESVFTMPDPTGATPPLEESERDELKEFVARIAASGKTALIVTTRTKEAWLGDVRRIELGGLAPDEAIEYAEHLLAPFPTAAAHRAQKEFADLLDWLDGHPLSMRLTLPHLATTSPEALLDALQGRGDLPDLADADGGRTTSLAASVAYSYEHLDDDVARRLVAVSMFQAVADGDVLGAMSSVDGCPARFAGVSREVWFGALDAAAGVGLLTPLGAGMYRVHPALPAYLAEAWKRDAQDGYEQDREAALRALLHAYAGLGLWLDDHIEGSNAATAYTVIGLQRRTLGGLLGLALDHELWPEAWTILSPLTDYFESRGLQNEARGWIDRGLLALEGADGSAPPLDDVAGQLWVYLLTAQGGLELGAHRPDEAERIYRRLIETLEGLDQSDDRRDLFAVAYHQLGEVERLRGNLEAAEEWISKSLAIKEELGDRRAMSTAFHQLGLIALHRDRMDAAADLFRKSLAILEELGDEMASAKSMHQIGMVAREQGDLDEAERWLTRAREIFESVGDRDLVPRVYHELGVIAQLRRQLNVAEAWYTRALSIKEQFGNDPSSLAMTYGQLGSLAELRSQDALALEWVVRCLALFPEFPSPATGPAPGHLVRLTSKLGMDALEACWQRVTGDALPDAVRTYVEENA